MVSRSLRLSLRNVDSLMTAFVLPILLMLMFVYLFGGAIHTGGRYVDYVVPGVLLVCVGFGAATTAVSVSQDLTTGIIDRFRSLDVRGEALINGHVVASVPRNLLSSALVFAVALAIGFRPHGAPGDWLAAIGILAAVRARAVVVCGGDRDRRALAGGRPGDHVPGQLPAVPEQRVRARAHDAVVAAGLRANQPATAVADSVRALLNGTAPGAQRVACGRLEPRPDRGLVMLAGGLYRRRAG